MSKYKVTMQTTWYRALISLLCLLTFVFALLSDPHVVGTIDYAIAGKEDGGDWPTTGTVFVFRFPYMKAYDGKALRASITGEKDTLQKNAPPGGWMWNMNQEDNDETALKSAWLGNLDGSATDEPIRIIPKHGGANQWEDFNTIEQCNRYAGGDANAPFGITMVATNTDIEDLCATEIRYRPKCQCTEDLWATDADNVADTGGTDAISPQLTFLRDDNGDYVPSETPFGSHTHLRNYRSLAAGFTGLLFLISILVEWKPLYIVHGIAFLTFGIINCAFYAHFFVPPKPILEFLLATHQFGDFDKYNEGELPEYEIARSMSFTFLWVTTALEFVVALMWFIGFAQYKPGEHKEGGRFSFGILDCAICGEGSLGGIPATFAGGSGGNGKSGFF